MPEVLSPEQDQILTMVGVLAALKHWDEHVQPADKVEKMKALVTEVGYPGIMLTVANLIVRLGYDVQPYTEPDERSGPYL